MLGVLKQIRLEINGKRNPQRAKVNASFFKTGKGEYGEGDHFVGLTVPESRNIAKQFNLLSFDSISVLLQSPVHEERLIALLILVHNFQKTKDQNERKNIFDFYWKNARKINNWDLVDLSADKIVGAYLFDNDENNGKSNDKRREVNSDKKNNKNNYKNDKKMLFTLAKSNNLWERRIAIVSTFYFIKNDQFEDALKISSLLLHDDHDLIHKAVGWMLREIGKRDQNVEEVFLKKHYRTMPRTMLRYAIERFDEGKRKQYLRK